MPHRAATIKEGCSGKVPRRIHLLQRGSPYIYLERDGPPSFSCLKTSFLFVEADEYAAELSRYIHMNPVRAGIVVRPEEYQWSSYRCFTGQITAPEWLK